MSRAASRCRAFALLSAAALATLAGYPGAASADGGRPLVNPDERAAALIRPAVMYLAAEAYGRVRLPSNRRLPGFDEGLTMPYYALWTCTSFVVNPDGWVATAGHCVDPESAKDLILKNAANLYLDQFPDLPEARDPAKTLEWLQANARVEGDTADQGPHISMIVVYGTGTKIMGKLPVNVVDFWPIKKGDVALLKVEKHDMPSSELGNDADVDIGTSILAVGFPKSTQRITDVSLDPTNKSGKVNKKSTMASIPEYEIDAAIAEGMSGGPTIELSGKVIGVNSFGPAGESQAFNFVAPADRLAALLAGKGVRPMLGPADMYYRKGLEAYYSGHYSDAIKSFDRAMSISPDYPGLAELKTKAANLRQQYGDVSVFQNSNLLWYIVSGALLVLVVGGWVVYLILRSRREPCSEAEIGDSEPVPGKPSSVVGAAAEHAGRHEAPESGVQPVADVPAQLLTATEPHYCANCGAEHHPAENFCPNCGNHIAIGEPA